jgi:putative ABC transport system permease protein
LIFQFAIAAFFIIGSYIVYEQIRYLQNKDLGFKGDQVISVALNFPPVEYEDQNVEKNIYNKYSLIKQQLSKIKGVEQISTGLIAFDGSDNFVNPVLYNDELFKERTIGLDYGMLEMLNVKIVKGRNFDRKLASDTINSVIINESALKQMNIKDPIGKELIIRGQKLRIIGIVKDFNLLSPEMQVPPISFYHLKTLGMARNINKVFIKLKMEDSENTFASIEKLWSQIDTEYPFKYDFVDKEYARTYESYVKQKNLFSLLNVIVIIIALFGLFALASYSIQRRMKEIAIRKTLGAETNILLKELSKQYVVYCAIGFLIAVFPAYFLLQKWLNNFAFRIEIPMLPFLLSFLLLLFLTLCIVLAKAYQATKVDVLQYLKYE